MADTQTKITVAYRAQGGSDLHNELQRLVDKASQLQSILSGLNIGGSGGGGGGFGIPPSAGGGTTGGSSLAGTLPMAQRARGGSTANVVTGGTSTQRGGNESWSQFPSYEFGSQAERGRVTSWAFDEKNRVPPSILAPEFKAGQQERRQQRDREQNFQNRSGGGGGGAWAGSIFEGNENWDTGPGPSVDFGPEDAATISGMRGKYGDRKPTWRDRMRGAMGGRLRYGIGMAAGLAAHGITSQWSKYWSTSFSAQPVVAAGMYSGDYFQMLQSQREAEALQQTATLGKNWAPATIGSQGLMGLGMAGLMAGGPAGWAIGGVGLIGGAAINMWGSYRQTGSQAAIDTETARTLAGMRTGQRMQSTTMSVMAAAMMGIPYGLSSMAQIDAWRVLGGESGVGPNEATAKMATFLRAGGRLSPTIATRGPNAFAGFAGPGIALTSQSNLSVSSDARGTLGDQIFELERKYGLSPETAGTIERGLLPGAGAGVTRASIVPAQLGARWANRTLSAGQQLGIGPQRINEFTQRLAAFEQQYAERGMTVPYGSAASMVTTFNPGMQGMVPLAAMEKMRDTSVGLGDQLTESMMPKRLVNALLMTRVIGEGGGPLDWSKKLYDPKYMRRQMAESGAIMPGMLRPFFEAQLSGMVPETADVGVYPSAVEKPVQGETPAAETLTNAAKQQAAADNATIRNWYDAVKTATDQLNALATAVDNAIFEISNGQSVVPRAD